MSDFATGLAAGIGAGIAIGLSMDNNDIVKKMEILLNRGNYRLTNADGKSLEWDDLAKLLKSKEFNKWVNEEKKRMKAEGTKI